ncbi:Cytochrome P450 monooxygenase pyr3 [Lasiodiplodia theobromae]|uniref:Cytochrome P450 monooxygenase pyr3 n=1 Tax=Lasiodiplodia theobromae TaxID=45133 RepID=A0A5N5D083_9PEZI|nr:Cytochrome P450 monooxygenase pyr3 [Lasiodiplodia theobromae]
MTIQHSVSPLNLPTTTTWELLAAALLLSATYAAYVVLTSQRPYPNIPLVGGEGGVSASKTRFARDAKGVLQSAWEQSKDRICQIFTDSGPRILLPPSFVDEIRNEAHLSFTEFVRREFMGDYKTFGSTDSLFKDSVFQETVRIKLTQALPRLTVGLSNEAKLAVNELFPATDEWTTMKDPLYATVVRLVSRLSAFAFLGSPLCRNKTWQRISAQYTVDVMSAVVAFRRWPRVIRPLVYVFHPILVPEIGRLQRCQKEAYSIIEPELRRRRMERKKAEELGGKKEKPLDSLQWLDETAAAKKSNVDTVMGQLGLTVAAIHTTSAALTNVMFDIVAVPGLADELREEIVRVMGDGGGEAGTPWQKTTLYKLRLMDSVMKESQRFNPPSVISMKRIALAPHTLSDGTYVPRGASIGVPVLGMMDPARYQDPETFDPYRFVKLRQQPGQENGWQYVTTSRDMFAFGHGAHACPGRFFASNEIKIALVHLLMGWDWAFEEEGAGRPKTKMRADQMLPDGGVRLVCRRRESEVAL